MSHGQRGAQVELGCCTLVALGTGSGRLGEAGASQVSPSRGTGLGEEMFPLSPTERRKMPQGNDGPASAAGSGSHVGRFSCSPKTYRPFPADLDSLQWSQRGCDMQGGPN